MAQYNNAAGRILAVLERVKAVKNPMEFAGFCKALGVEKSWSSALTAVTDLQDEFETLRSEIEGITDNPAKVDLFKTNLAEIEASVRGFHLQMRDNRCQYNIHDSAVVALRFIAADLPQEADADPDDLGRIRDVVSELQKEIEDSDTFGPMVREWLLSLVRIIRDSLDRFAVRGARGMRRQLSSLVGELYMNYGQAQKVKEQTPGIWQKIMTGLDRMAKLSSLMDRLKPGIGMGLKGLTWIKNLALPAPDNDALDESASE